MQSVSTMDGDGASATLERWKISVHWRFTGHDLGSTSTSGNWFGIELVGGIDTLRY